MTAEPPLPRADAEEKFLFSCLMDWPERSGEILRLCRPTDFFHPLHQKLWRKFATQLATTGSIDRLAAGKELNCAEFLLELTDGAPTTAYAESQADAVKLAARGRQAHGIFSKAAH